ncbi:MAG: AMP-binding protein [Flavobacteriales bacterium]|nr:AMP-binding protein [Flavobacteriales bacterium]MBP9080700.1 AMP-binding protein [Flavobacteriales bacterium]
MEQSLSEVVLQRARIHPQRVAYVFGDATVTYAEFGDHCGKAASLCRDLGLKKGDRIGILALNGRDVVELLFGAITAGVVPVSLPWKATPQEWAGIVQDAGVRHVFVSQVFAPAMAVFPADVAVHALDRSAWGSLAPAERTGRAAAIPADLAAIIYTSGTTGRPKGVMLSHANLYACASLSAMETPGLGPTSRLLVCGPLYSIFGFGAFFCSLYAGSTAVLMPMFDPAATLHMIQDQQVTHALFAPIMMRAMAALPDAQTFNLRSLQHIQYGGSPMPEALLRQVGALFQCDLTQVYGLTETTGVGCALRYDDHRAVLANDEAAPPIGSAGKAGLGIELRVCDDQGNLQPVGEPGEVRMRGDVVALGYWGDPEHNDRFLPDGWFLTGDIGVVDQAGFLTLVDRRNDMIVSKGMNIFPTEIEQVLEKHPDVKECAVVSAPHEDFGEEVCAVLVCTARRPDLLEVRKWCEGKVALGKLPSRVEFAESLPRTLTGKVLRRAVRAPFWKDETKGVRG